MAKQSEEYNQREFERILSQSPGEFKRSYARLQNQPDPTEQAPKTSRIRRVLWWIAGISAAACLPFVILIRSSISAYQTFGFSTWPALLFGSLCTIAVLLIYGLIIWYKREGSRRALKLIWRSSTVIVSAFLLYSLLYISSLNTKSETVREYYTSLHPIIRVAVTTATLFDNDLVMTDNVRTREDYREMGLSPLNISLHYLQPSGYVHAVDLRTIGRSAWKNWLLQGYFELMGFDTLRHVGTADHLHVALPS